MSSAASAAADAGPLLERAAELDEAEGALAAASSGRGGLLVVEGPAGIGKTRLLRAAADLASNRGWDVLRASASELERALPFLPRRPR